jgi:hypothetical protein
VYFWANGATQAVPISIRNPFPRDLSEAQPEPLPATRTNGPYVFTLRRFEPTSGMMQFVGYWPIFDVTKDGQPSLEWRGSAWHFRDVGGAMVSDFLCTNSRAWKLSASFERRPTAAFQTNEIWIVPELKVPSPNEAIVLRLEHAWPGVTLQLRGLRHHRTVTNAVSAAEKAGATNSPPARSADVAVQSRPFRNRLSPRPKDGLYLDLEVSAPHSEGKGLRGTVVLIRGTDDRGRSFPTSFSNQHRSFPSQARLDIPENARSFILEIVVHQTFDMEFVVAPPLQPFLPEDARR